MFSKPRPRIRFQPGTQTVFIWLIVAVVVPSLLLSLFSFWAMRRQEQLAGLRARHRAFVLLSDAEADLLTGLETLKAKFSVRVKEVAEADSVAAIEQGLPSFSSQEALVTSLFLLDVEGNVLLPQAPPLSPPMQPPNSPAWNAAQREEFTQKNLERAIQLYQAIGGTNAQLSSYATSAIARCAVKRGDFATAEESFTTWKVIWREFRFLGRQSPLFGQAKPLSFDREF